MHVRRAASLMLIPVLLAASCSHAPPTPTPTPTPAKVEPSPKAPEPTPAEPVEAPTPAPKPEPVRELFPGLRLDRSAGAVEFDGEIVQDGRAGGVTYLELLACRPNSFEHEAIVLSPITASNLHAALLLAGGLPGSPGRYTFDQTTKAVTPHAPTGAGVRIVVRWEEGGVRKERPLAEMVKDVKTGRSLAATPGARFVFAGSGFLKRKDGTERYAADVSGSLIGLCTFGDETVAWSRVVSPEESIDEPEWIVDPAGVPPKGTRVVVRLTLEAPPAPAP